MKSPRNNRHLAGKYHLWTIAGALLAGLTFSAGTQHAQAETFDPTAPVVRVIGPPSGAAPRPRLDDARTGRSKLPLPTLPVELWRHELPGLDVTPVVTDGGEVVAALASPLVVKLNRKGKELWRTRLGSSAAMVPPVLTSDGSVAILTQDGELWRISADGKPLVRVKLGTGSRRNRRRAPLATPLALDDASVVVALPDGLVRVDAGGQILARVRLGSSITGGLLRWKGKVLAVNRAGEVMSWDPPHPVKVLGRFAGRLYGGALLASERTLVGVVDRTTVIALDLKTGNRTPLLSSATVMTKLEGPPTLDHKDRLLVTTALGELLALDGHGTIVARTALDNFQLFRAIRAGTNLPSIYRRVNSRNSPGLITDAQGRIGFARGTGKVGIIRESGELVVVNSRLCSRPLAILPAGKKRMLVACDSGTLAVFGSRKP